MGRPLTDRWIGVPSNGNPVLKPIIRLGSAITRGYILKQIGSDKFLVQCAETGNVGSCRLTNTTDMPMGGLMCLRFSGMANGYVSRISNTKLRDFHGNQFPWSIHGPSEGMVHVIDSSLADK